jgi:hypothetical protein
MKRQEFMVTVAAMVSAPVWKGFGGPDIYFSVFKEIADIFVTMIRGGASLGPSFVPDISVGQLWSKYWIAENLEILCGERKKYEHNYPLYFPQSASRCLRRPTVTMENTSGS